MKATKETLLAAVFLGLSCLTSTSLAGPSDTSCSINIPAGTIIRVYPDEQLVAGTTSGPLLFTTAADVRFFLNRLHFSRVDQKYTKAEKGTVSTWPSFLWFQYGMPYET